MFTLFLHDLLCFHRFVYFWFCCLVSQVLCLCICILIFMSCVCASLVEKCFSCSLLTDSFNSQNLKYELITVWLEEAARSDYLNSCQMLHHYILSSDFTLSWQFCLFSLFFSSCICLLSFSVSLINVFNRICCRFVWFGKWWRNVFFHHFTSLCSETLKKSDCLNDSFT